MPPLSERKADLFYVSFFLVRPPQHLLSLFRLTDHYNGTLVDPHPRLRPPRLPNRLPSLPRPPRYQLPPRAVHQFLPRPHRRRCDGLFREGIPGRVVLAQELLVDGVVVPGPRVRDWCLEFVERCVPHLTDHTNLGQSYLLTSAMNRVQTSLHPPPDIRRLDCYHRSPLHHPPPPRAHQHPSHPRRRDRVGDGAAEADPVG